MIIDMNWIEILLIALLVLGELLSLYLSSTAKRLGENNADILQNRLKEYESEKGKNLATKEDIEEITKKVEDVKTEISLSKQKRYEQLAEQERILLAILNEASQVSQSQNKIILYLYDTSSRKRYDTLVENVNDTLTRFYHLCNLAVVCVPLDDIEDVVKDLSIAVTYLGAQVNVTATNAASLVEQYNKQMDYAMDHAEDANKAAWFAASIQTKQQLEAMRGKSIDGKDALRVAIEKYCAWLKQQYGRDVFVFKS